VEHVLSLPLNVAGTIQRLDPRLGGDDAFESNRRAPHACFWADASLADTKLAKYLAQQIVCCELTRNRRQCPLREAQLFGEEIVLCG